MKTREYLIRLAVFTGGLFIGSNFGIFLYGLLIAGRRRAEQAAAHRWHAIAEHYRVQPQQPGPTFEREDR